LKGRKLPCCCAKKEVGDKGRESPKKKIPRRLKKGKKTIEEGDTCILALGSGQHKIRRGCKRKGVVFSANKTYL